TRKKQDGTNGICDSKVSLTLQCHNGKNLNEKSRSRGINHSFYDQVPDEPGGCHDGDKQGDPIGMIREQAILQTRRNLGQRSGKEPMFPKEGEGEDSTRKKITICSKRPGHCVTIGSTLSIGCKQQLVNVLQDGKWCLADADGLFKPQQNMCQRYVPLFGSGRKP
ncbi:hypothetical protein Tco_1513957, partial [Tanacetum coccineum]